MVFIILWSSQQTISIPMLGSNTVLHFEGKLLHKCYNLACWPIGSGVLRTTVAQRRLVLPQNVIRANTA